MLEVPVSNVRRRFWHRESARSSDAEAIVAIVRRAIRDRIPLTIGDAADLADINALGGAEVVSRVGGGMEQGITWEEAESAPNVL
jgi:hypothetical protein